MTSSNHDVKSVNGSGVADLLPMRRDLYYGGEWHTPTGGYAHSINPATQEDLGECAVANADDVDKAVRAAHAAFPAWRDTRPEERAERLYKLADLLRENATSLAGVDALDCGNPVCGLVRDVYNAAVHIDYFAGLVRELKGETHPMGSHALNYSRCEPYGVVARIVAYNHPLMFLAAKLAPAVAAGNTVVLKSSAQAPLSGYCLAELLDQVFPKGVVNILSGGRECGEALVAHPLVRKVALIGSVATGVAVLKMAANKIMPATLELGGKNPVIVYPDADVEKAIQGVIAGMNLLWAGQSCGSTSRAFVHRSLYERVVAELGSRIPRLHRCGLPKDPETTTGCLISQDQFDKVMSFIDSAHREGARLVCGGERPSDPGLSRGWFVEPTVFADVTESMRLFREEVFGPVLAVIPWDDEEDMLRQVNSLEYGLTASIWTRDLGTAHHVAARIESGYVWVNHVSEHFVGAEFGGYKQSGLGREEGLSELYAFSQKKNVHVVLPERSEHTRQG